MAWLLGFAFVAALVGVFVFVLMRDSFRARAGARGENPAAPASPGEGDKAARLNALVREHLPVAEESAVHLPPEHEDAEKIAEGLGEVVDNPVLPQAPKAYLRMVVEDDTLERLLSRNSRAPSSYTLPGREFHIEVGEERPAEPPERKTPEKRPPHPAAARRDTSAARRPRGT